MAVMTALTGCPGGEDASGEIIPVADPVRSTEETALNSKIIVTANGQSHTATLGNSSSARAFADLLKQGRITVDMRDYGGFEKVGNLKTELPQNDHRITTSPGDIILYQGRQITIYYDTNSWSLTLLGHIEDATGENMREFLGVDSVTVEFSLPEENGTN